ncbi:alcohol dehydrogenase [Fibrisoma montanum]|uniref:Alcohol dehydrogenase n=2 Tax=Fibrisoma montanum TaxID=2305895 RepID=A0A418MK28_9BACT|nr:alcohol dehydrogenase [Fibrisoma montanum]
MRSVVVKPDAPGRIHIDTAVPTPEPSSSEALVRVAAISLNRGDVRSIHHSQAGFRPGWDLAGIVEQAAADCSGPKIGEGVVGFVPSGGWAELVAVPRNSLAVLPDTVSFSQAATLPIAGLSALYALERNGSLLGQTVLITGATGGVGLFACQLARLAGVRVVALIRRPEQAELVRQAGAHEVVVSADGAEAAGYGPYHLIVESVGGQVLGNVMGMLIFGGVCVTLGASESAEASFNIRLFFMAGGALQGFFIFNEIRRHSAAMGLSRLLQLVATGQLQTSISIETPWTNIAEVTQQLLDRQFSGKAVLTING